MSEHLVVVVHNVVYDNVIFDINVIIVEWEAMMLELNVLSPWGLIVVGLPLLFLGLALLLAGVVAYGVRRFVHEQYGTGSANREADGLVSRPIRRSQRGAVVRALVGIGVLLTVVGGWLIWNAMPVIMAAWR